MKRDLTPEALRALNELLSMEVAINDIGKSTPAAPQGVRGVDRFSRTLMGPSTPETPEEIAKLKSALGFLSSDVGRGSGSFYGSTGQPIKDYWLAAIWAIASLGWTCGKEIARDWSKLAPARYDDAGFDQAWNGYRTDHPNPVTVASLYKRAKDFGWTKPQPVQPQHASRYKLLDGIQIRSLPPLSWLVKGVLPSKGLAAVFGPSASGKSLLTLDMGTAIADGKPWFGRRTHPTPVVYVALEGEGGYQNRVAAWENEKGRPISPNLHFVMQPFKINDEDDVIELASAIPQGAVVFIDTLNRASPTADENSSRDMGEILEGAKRLQKCISGLVVLIHHTGKDTSRGARGHSSFFAALDAAIQVERTAAGRSWNIAKAKDGEDGIAYPFKLKRHVLGFDSDGEEISSCTIERDYGQLFNKHEPTGRNQITALRMLKQAISSSTTTSKAGCGENTHCINLNDAVTAVSSALITVAANKRNNQARTLITGLVTSGHLQSGLEGDEVWIWITP